MVAKLFTKPFGVAGDKTPIPDDTQVDGTVSYQTGFGADYERQLGVDPAAKNIGRQTFNELMFDATTSLQEMQAGFGTSPYSLALAQSLPGGGYPKGALIPRLAGDGFWLCTVAANTSNPDTGGAGWIQIAAQGSFYAIDTGVANAYSCVFSPALTARSEVQPLTVRIKFTNTGASTINDGLGTVPLVGLAQAALQGGEVAANGIAVLQWVAAINSYVVVYATGGAVQVASATKSLQAVNAGQIQAQNVTAFNTTGTATAQILSPVPASLAYSANQRFNVTFNTTSGVAPTINVSGLGAKNIKQYDATGAKVAAFFAANQNSDIVYDGTDFVMLDPLPSSFGVTPPQFDNSNKLATTAFMQGVGLQFSSYVALGVSTTLTAASHAGAMIVGNSASAINATLPLSSTMPARTAIKFWNFLPGVMTVVAAGADVIYSPSGATSFPMQQGACVTLVSTGSGAWLAVDSNQQATESFIGAAKIATTTKATTGLDDTDIMTALKTKQAIAAFDSKCIGDGQTWQDLTASRALSTTYTNSTGRTIGVMYEGISSSSASACVLNINGSLIRGGVAPATLQTGSGVFLVPNGATYLASGITTMSKWWELK